MLPADTVILAVGQGADVSFLGAGIELERTRAGGVQIDPATRCERPIRGSGPGATSPRAAKPDRRDRRRTGAPAASIHSVLTGAAPPPRTRIARGPGRAARAGFRRLDSDYDAIPRQRIPATPTERRVGFGEVELGYDEHQARLEGLRCLRCFDNVMLSPELCILCGLCVDVCPPDCITIARADHVGLGSSRAQSVLLLDEDLCIRCGLCVNRCPPGALSMVHARELTHD